MNNLLPIARPTVFWSKIVLKYIRKQDLLKKAGKNYQPRLKCFLCGGRGAYYAGNWRKASA
jgi:hypothetical protein